MSRSDKATLRAEGRERRRRPPEEAQQDEQPNGDNRRQEKSPAEKPEPPRGAGGDELAEIAAQARELLRSLRGVEAESVSGIGRANGGWRVTLEVVELRRIPDSTDVLASYDVELDGDGKFLGFERGRRYTRSQAEGAGR